MWNFCWFKFGVTDVTGVVSWGTTGLVSRIVAFWGVTGVILGCYICDSISVLSWGFTSVAILGCYRYGIIWCYRCIIS